MVGPCKAGSRPKIVSSPEVTGETPPIMRIVDVLPAPFGPRKPNASPLATSKSMPSTASRSPNLLVSWRASINELEALTGDLLSLSRRERVRVRAVGLSDVAQGRAALSPRRCCTHFDRRRPWGFRPPAPDGGARRLPIPGRVHRLLRRRDRSDADASCARTHRARAVLGLGGREHRLPGGALGAAAAPAQRADRGPGDRGGAGGARSGAAASGGHRVRHAPALGRG